MDGDPKTNELVEQWRVRGKFDGERHYPASDQDVTHLAEQLWKEVIERETLSLAGELEAGLAQILASNGVETLSIEDVQVSFISQAASCAAEMATLVPEARVELIKSRHEARDAKEDLTAFQNKYQAELQGRAPLPESLKSESWIKRRSHWGFIITIFLLEAGGFYLLGKDYWKEALKYGLMGGAISGFFLWALRYAIRKGEKRISLTKGRASRVVKWIIAGHLLFAYWMACVRDGLYSINHHDPSDGTSLDMSQFLVWPWALSPGSVLVVVLAAVLVLAIWLTSVGRSPFPFEDDYRRLWSRWKASESAIDAAKKKPFDDLKRIIEQSRNRLAASQKELEETHRRCRMNFGTASRTMRNCLVQASQARSDAARCWDAYSTANRRARARGNPPPSSLNSPLPVAETLDFERDMLASFNDQLQHALELAGHGQQAMTHAQRVLSIYSADLLAYLERLIVDPGLTENPPSFEIVKQQIDGPLFRSTSEKRVGSGEAVRRFLSLQERA